MDDITQPDLCPDCGHEGYDGHDMRSIPPACTEAGCTCGDPLYYPTLDTVEDVLGWIVSWQAVGGWPHPDDSAWLTCEQQIALGYGKYHAAEPSHEQGGHLGIVGPAAPQTKTDALAFDAAMTRAHEIVNAAGGDIYAMALDSFFDGNTVTVYVRLDFKPDGDTGPLSVQGVKDALEARLDEVYAGVGNFPVTPTVTFIDGPDASTD